MKNILLYIFVFLSVIAKGQTKLPSLSIDNPNIALYINSNIKLDIDTFCLHTVIFIKFSVNKNGEISNLGFTKKSPKIITEALKTAVLSSNGHWKIKNKDLKYLNKKVFILPFILDLNIGCNIESELQDPIKKKENMAKAIENLVSQQIGFKSNDAVSNILDFDDGSLNFLNCIILSPIRMGNMGY